MVHLGQKLLSGKSVNFQLSSLMCRVLTCEFLQVPCLRLNQKGLIMSKEEQGTEAGRNASCPKQNNYLVGEIKIYTTEINVSNRNAK